MADETTIKCVRCPKTFVAGDVLGPRGMSREDIIAMVIGQIGWRKTFAGWQCPEHSHG